jgi:hypothetical protein
MLAQVLLLEWDGRGGEVVVPAQPPFARIATVSSRKRRLSMIESIIFEACNCHWPHII